MSLRHACVRSLLCAALAIAFTSLSGLSPAHAQSICSTPIVGTLNCLDPAATITGTISSGANVLAGPGLNAGSTSDLTVNLLGNVTTSGTDQAAVLLSTTDDLIFNSSDTIATLGPNSDAVNLTGTSVNADLGTLTTQGVNAQGLQVLSTNGPITADVDAIQTNGSLSSATVLRGTGDVNLSAGVLRTGGTDAVAFDISSDPAACVLLGAGGCDVTAIADTVTTDGFGGIGGLVSATGDTNVNVGVLRTGGDQAAGLNLGANPAACVVLGVGACDSAFTVGNLTTTGTDSPGAIVRAAGDITGNVGVLQTSGDRAIGLDLASSPDACVILGAGACDTSFNVGTLTTQGDGATGLLVRAAGDTAGTVNLLETNGDGATGVDIASDPTACVIVGVGACDVGLTANQVTTRGNDSGGVLINAIGDITTNLGAVTTSGDGSPGVSLLADPLLCAAIGPGTCVIDDRTGSVTTGGDDSPGTVVSGGSDPVTVVVGPTTTTGDNSPGVDVDGSGPITVGTGPITTGGDGSAGVIIDGGAGPVVLTCGNIVTTGPNSPGVDVSGTGAISISCQSVTTSGINSDGINVEGGAGPVTVTTGPVITRGLNSPGIDVATTTGAQLITANGVNVAAAGVNAIEATASGCANLSINATDDVISGGGTAILASTPCAVTITTQPGATVAGAAAGINATSGTGTTITLGDAVSSATGPAIDANGAAAAIAVNAGGSIVGRIDLTDAADSVVNGGLFQVVGTSDFRGGADVFTNLAAGSVRLTDGIGALANCESFNNAGTITMIDGAANDTLSICGNYVGSGAASLGIDVGVAAGALTSDRLIIGGDASGSTLVNIGLLATPVIDPDGVLIVDAATAAGTPFALGGQRSFGLIDLALVQNGGDTFLVATPNAAIFDVAALGTFAEEIAYQPLEAHEACAASRRNDFGKTREGPIGVCAQLYASRDRSGDRTNSATVFGTSFGFSDRLHTDRRGAQVELGIAVGDRVEVGVTGGYAWSDADLASGTTLTAEGYNYGIYGQFGSAAGLYGGAVVKRDDYDIRFGNGAIIAEVRPDARSTTVDGELGYRTPGFGATVDVDAGLTSVRTRIDDFTTGNIAFDNDRVKSLRGRIGARLGWSGELAPFVGGKLYREFKGDSRTSVASGALTDRIEGQGRGTWGRLEAGLGGRVLASAWVDVGDVRGVGVRAGFRF